MEHRADPQLIVLILRQKAKTDPLLQAQLEAAFWEAVATNPAPDDEEPDTDDGE